MSGVYQIRNLINNKIYIGSAIDFSARFKKHKRELINNQHHSIHLQRAWNKHSEENFLFEILEVVERISGESNSEFEKRLTRLYEQKHLDTFLFAQDYINKINSKFRKLSYNINPTAGSSLGFKHSEATKRFLSEVGKGNKNGKGNKGKKSGKRKAIIRVSESGEIKKYETVLEASIDMGSKNSYQLYSALKGRIKTYKTYIWKYELKNFGLGPE